MSPKRAPRIFVLNDDPSALEFLTTLLELQGCEARGYANSGRFLDAAARGAPDLLLIDLELPGIDGWAVLKLVKEHAELRSVPVILVSARYRDSQDVVRGLQAGADDYIQYPSPAEFIAARVQALLRRRAWRGGEPAADTLRLGELTVESDAHLVRLGGEEVSLTPLEFALLAYLLHNRNRVLTRGHILEHVWRSDAALTSRTVDKHVEQLRRKLGPVGRKIETVVRVGYRLRG
ncbi:MAG: response regulator transcription factor [Elusimicrobia bacterium]|nr:response regulator transcription factor [Elusimicrobiota bacterium]